MARRMVPDEPLDDVTAASNSTHSLGLCQLNICLQNHRDRFLQIFTRFSQSCTLRVCTRQLSNERSVSFGEFSEDSAQFDLHVDFGIDHAACRNHRQRQGWRGRRFQEAATSNDCLVIARPVSPLLCWCERRRAIRHSSYARPSRRCSCRKRLSLRTSPQSLPCRSLLPYPHQA
jgi:hypothetical protein